jgi:hypothetical protein
MGLINTSKFCTHKQATCVVAGHALKKFNPEVLTGYLHDMEIHAWCQPVFDTSGLNKSQLYRLQETQLASLEWTELFQQLKQGVVPKWLSVGEPEVKAPALEVDTHLNPITSLMSPFAHEQTGGLLSSIPVLSFDDSVESAESGFSPEDLDSTEIATYAGLVKLSFLETKVDESLYGSGIRLWPFGKRFSKATPGFDGMQSEHWGQT